MFIIFPNLIHLVLVGGDLLALLRVGGGGRAALRAFLPATFSGFIQDFFDMQNYELRQYIMDIQYYGLRTCRREG